MTLVASPSYPNSIIWSNENLIAVSCGHVITIINPDLPVRPRGLITLPQSNPFRIGRIKEEDLLAPQLMPVTLVRDIRPCARSISWSPPGFSPNSGCLLAVCTVEGYVKIYRSPYCEYRAEWVEVVDISDILHNYYRSINFGETKDFPVKSSQGKTKKGSINESGSNNKMDNADTKKLPDLKKSRLSRKFPPFDNFVYAPVTVSQGITKEDSIDESGSNTCLVNADSLDIRKSSTSKRCRNKKIKYDEFIEDEPSNNKDEDYHNQNSEENYDENEDVDNNDEEDDDFDDSIPAKKIKLSMNKGSSLNYCSNSKPASYSKKFANGQKNKREKDASDLISTKQCASRISLLSSLIVAWSPTLKSSEPIDVNVNFSILAVGGKSGNISFWKISEPRCYTIEHGRVFDDPILIGIIQAHSSWITAISWSIYGASSSEAKLVLATGSCDGSVKLWLGNVEDLIHSLEINNDIFSLLRVVADVTYVPVSTISTVAPSTSTNTIVLAVGRGSGSLDIYSCGITSEKFENMGVYDAHKQAVTGLTWTVDGCRLYSCSQDNSVRSWLLDEKSVLEAPFPLNFPGIKNPLDLSAVLNLCFGIALSPGGLVAAVVRSFDSNLLNQMYEARVQKAAVEFYWTGAHLLETPSNKELINCIKENPKLAMKDLLHWQSTILWSLKHFESGNLPLVLWDNLTALLSFLKSSPLFAKNIVSKWFSSWSLGSLESIANMQSIIKLSTHKIHLLNIICRRLMLSESNELEGVAERKKAKSWSELLANCEREIQERFVAFTFKAVLLSASFSTSDPEVENWSPVGVAQIKKWVDTVKPDIVHDQLKLLGSDIGKLKSRVQSVCEYQTEEECCYCSAPVPFESTGAAKCEGVANQEGEKETHELIRCAVSMKLCSVTAPMWYCTCCKRQVFHLPPLSFFTMLESPLDVDFGEGSLVLRKRLIPWCIFCGVLMQRILPDFLLSASPV